MEKKSTALFFIIVSLIPRLSLALFFLSNLFICAASAKVKSVTLENSPILVGDKVNLRVKIKGTDDQFISNLKQQNFQIKVDGVLQNNFQFQPVELAHSQKSWIIILLDMSINNKEAVQTIKQLITDNNIQISLVPFGNKTKNCQGFTGYKDSAELDRFLLAKDAKVQNYLDYLQTQGTCAATDIYMPLEQALKLLSNQRDSRFYPGEDNLEKPKLSIILLSTGRKNDAIQERNLKKLLSFVKDMQKNSNYNPITVNILTYAPHHKDDSPIQKMADATGGIWEFAADPTAIARKLYLVLDSLAGKYELSYIHPRATRASKHKVTIAANGVSSNPSYYTITVFGRSLPFEQRLLIAICTIVLLCLGGILPFTLWGKILKNKNN